MASERGRGGAHARRWRKNFAPDRIAFAWRGAGLRSLAGQALRRRGCLAKRLHLLVAGLLADVEVLKDLSQP